MNAFSNNHFLLPTSLSVYSADNGGQEQRNCSQSVPGLAGWGRDGGGRGAWVRGGQSEHTGYKKLFHSRLRGK